MERHAIRHCGPCEGPVRAAASRPAAALLLCLLCVRPVPGAQFFEGFASFCSALRCWQPDTTHHIYQSNASLRERACPSSFPSLPLPSAFRTHRALRHAKTCTLNQCPVCLWSFCCTSSKRLPYLADLHARISASSLRGHGRSHAGICLKLLPCIARSMPLRWIDGYYLSLKGPAHNHSPKSSRAEPLSVIYGITAASSAAGRSPGS
jgi:hypothetical protein